MAVLIKSRNLPTPDLPRTPHRGTQPELHLATQSAEALPASGLPCNYQVPISSLETSIAVLRRRVIDTENSLQVKAFVFRPYKLATSARPAGCTISTRHRPRVGENVYAAVDLTFLTVYIFFKSPKSLSSLEFSIQSRCEKLWGPLSRKYSHERVYLLHF